MTDPLEDMFEVSSMQKSDGKDAILKIEDVCFQILAKKERRAAFGPLCRFDQTPANTFPLVGPIVADARKIDNQNFRFPAGLFMPEKSRRNDLCVIDHQNIR
jgi:hypothetical protein